MNEMKENLRRIRQAKWLLIFVVVVVVVNFIIQVLAFLAEMGVFEE